jgi:hypothetical protein
MKTTRLTVISTLAGSVLFLASNPVFSQVASSNRVPQQVVINGQTVSAVSVIAAGGAVQRYSCLNPQQFTTTDGTSQGWACYDASAGVWLLNALPPAQAQAPQVQAPQPQVQQAPVPPPVAYPQPQVVYPQPQVVYPQPAPTVVYQQPPAVIYQPATVVYPQPATIVYPQPATVVYQPAPAVIYQQPATVIYEPVRPVRTVVVGPVYPSSVVFGTAAINAAGRIASAAIIAHGHDHVRYVTERRVYDRGWRR